MNVPLSSTPSIASRIRGRSGSYWALTSTSGIGRTAAKSRLSPPANYEKRCEHENSGNRRIIRKSEIAVEGLVAAAEPPANRRNGKAPDGRPDQREHGVAPKPHAEDPGRNRAEGAHDRSQPADEHGKVVPAVEPPLGPLELVGAQVQPAATLVQQRPAAVQPKGPPGHGSDQVSERSRRRHHEVRRNVRRHARPE